MPEQAAGNKKISAQLRGDFLLKAMLQHLGQERLQAGMLGVGEQLLRGLVLLDFAVVDEDDAVGDLARKAHLMGDDQHGDAGVGQLLHQFQDLADHFGVQRGGGLIEEDDVRVHGQGAGNGDALLLAAGQALGVGVGLVGQADAGQQLFSALVRFLLVLQLQQGGGQAEVLLDRQVREEVEVLEHHPHLLADGINVAVIDLDALKLDGAAGGDLQPIQAAQEGRLAAAGRADLFPMRLMISADGPIKVMLHCWQSFAKRAFSDKNPNPG